MNDQMAKPAAFQANVRFCTRCPSQRADEAGAAAGAIHEKLPMISLSASRCYGFCAIRPTARITAVLYFVGKLPNELAEQVEVLKQLGFAPSNAGKHIESIPEREALIDTSGPMPERLELLGGQTSRDAWPLAVVYKPAGEVLHAPGSLSSRAVSVHAGGPP